MVIETAVSAVAAVTTAVVLSGRSRLEFLVLFLNVLKEVFAEFLGLVDHLRIGAPEAPISLRLGPRPREGKPTLHVGTCPHRSRG